MDFDPSFLDAIRGFEGFSPTASWDYKQYTNGYGTRANSPNETIDQATAEQRLQSELTKAAGSVDSLGVQMPPGARNALTSLTYNAGPGWMQSGLGDAVKAGDWNGVAQKLLEYNKAGGAVNPGLSARRAQEASWITGGVPPAPQANGLLAANAIGQSRTPSLPLFAGAASPSALPASPEQVRGPGDGSGSADSPQPPGAPAIPQLSFLRAFRPRVAQLPGRLPLFRQG